MSEGEQGEVFVPNAHFSEGIDPILLQEKLHAEVNSPGGTVDQMFLYTSPVSASLWRQESNLEGYKSMSSIPIKEIAKNFVRCIKKTQSGYPRLTLVSLGSGEVQQEQWLIQALLQKKAVRGVSLYMVDASYPLLTAGFKGCHRVFRFYPEVCTLGVYANFYHLNQNNDFLAIFAEPNQVNLVTMLGHTFGNLVDETVVMNNAFSILPSKTFLLLDIALPYANSESPKDIMKKDPWLKGLPPWRRLAQDFWATPFVEHHPNVHNTTNVAFAPVLDYLTCHIPGSYAVEIRAFVERHEFAIQRFKRYDIDRFLLKFKEIGFSLVSTYPFHYRTALAVLFQKD